MAYIYELILIYAPAARLCRLSSTHRLLERRKGTNRSGSALLCGDVDYYARFAPTPTTNDSLAFSLYCGNRTEFLSSLIRLRRLRAYASHDTRPPTRSSAVRKPRSKRSASSPRATRWWGNRWWRCWRRTDASRWRTRRTALMRNFP